MKEQVAKFWTNPDLKKSYKSTLERYGAIEVKQLPEVSEVIAPVGDSASDAMFAPVSPDEEDND